MNTYDSTFEKAHSHFLGEVLISRVSRLAERSTAGQTTSVPILMTGNEDWNVGSYIHVHMYVHVYQIPVTMNITFEPSWRVQNENRKIFMISLGFIGSCPLRTLLFRKGK